MSHLISIEQTFALTSTQLAQVTIRAMNQIMGEYKIVDGVVYERVERKRHYDWVVVPKSDLTDAQFESISAATQVISNIETALGVTV